MLRIRIRDPVLFWYLDPGWEKSGSGINNSDHISEILVRQKSGSGMEKSSSGINHPGFATLPKKY
jgi:hypothetical protein